MPKTILLAVLLVCLSVPAFAQTSVQAADRHDWQALASLQAGDRVRLSLKTGRVDGAFQNWTPVQVTVETVTAKREDVRKIERYRTDAWGRGKKVAVGALAGFGSGFVLGIATGGCDPGAWFCFNRGTVGVFLGATLAIIGAGVGALLPSHARELIYSAT